MHSWQPSAKHHDQGFWLLSIPIRSQMHRMGQGWPIPALICTLNTSAGYFQGITPLHIAKAMSASPCSTSHALQKASYACKAAPMHSLSAWRRAHLVLLSSQDAYLCLRKSGHPASLGRERVYHSARARHGGRGRVIDRHAHARASKSSGRADLAHARLT